MNNLQIEKIILKFTIRPDLEEKAEFLGLIVMQNLVKEETYPAIKALHDADINTVMVTGDNILTAISVGRDCELVKPDQVDHPYMTSLKCFHL
jgi:cation-transporting ATPase 13A2